MEISNEKIKQLLFECYKYAELHSDDKSNQNAAMILNPNIDNYGEYFAIVSNCLPKGVIKTDERIYKRPMKYAFIEHAERGVIYEAARMGVSTYNTTMVCPWIACENCARAIVCAGIKKVIAHKQRIAATSLNRDKVKDTVDNRWVNPVSDGDIIIKEGGVEVFYYDGTIDGLNILVNEQIMNAI